jgi:hypothetical protein
MVFVIQALYTAFAQDHGPARKLSTNLYDIYYCWVYSEEWINSWWWADELSETGTCRVSCQNKFVKLVHLVDFIIKILFWVVIFPLSTVEGTNTWTFMWKSNTHVAFNLMCLSATSPTAASVRRWLKHVGVKLLLPPADALRYQCGPAHWHGTVTKTLPAYLTSRKPNIATYQLTGGGYTAKHTHKNTKQRNTSLIM